MPETLISRLMVNNTGNIGLGGRISRDRTVGEADGADLAANSSGNIDGDEHDYINSNRYEELAAISRRTGNKPGRKRLDTEAKNRRTAQNRAAQRAFRERKERRMRELEDRVKELEGQRDELLKSETVLRAQVEVLGRALERHESRAAVMQWMMGAEEMLPSPNSSNSSKSANSLARSNSVGALAQCAAGVPPVPGPSPATGEQQQALSQPQLQQQQALESFLPDTTAVSEDLNLGAHFVDDRPGQEWFRSLSCAGKGLSFDTMSPVADYSNTWRRDTPDMGFAEETEGTAPHQSIDTQSTNNNDNDNDNERNDFTGQGSGALFTNPMFNDHWISQETAEMMLQDPPLTFTPGDPNDPWLGTG